MSGTWQSATDLSSYHFNAVSAAGVQRRKCAFTTVGPNAANADCVPADCQIKVVFTATQVTGGGTQPIYEWQTKTTPEMTYAQLGTDYAHEQYNCAYPGMDYRNCVLTSTVHPERATTTTRPSCPAGTMDLNVHCTDPTHTLVMAKHGRTITVRTSAKVWSEKVVLQKRVGSRWKTRATKSFSKTRIAWTRKVTHGRFRIVITPGRNLTGRIIKEFRVR